MSNQAYVAGDEVSYNGHEWTANQWNYDEVPGRPGRCLERRRRLLTQPGTSGS